MRVLTTPGHGFQWLRYSATGRQLLGLGRTSSTWWLWDLASGTPGVRLAKDDPRLNLWRLLRVRHGDDFLRAQGYWPASEEWPVGDGLRPEHREAAEWAEDFFRSPCFTPDGQGILLETVGELYRTPDQLAIWDFEGRIVRSYALADPSRGPNDASFSPDGRLLALAFFRNLEVRETDTDRIRIQTTNEQEVHDHALSPDGHWLAASAGRIVRTVDVRARLGAHRFPAFRAMTETLAFSPDSRLLAAGSREGRVRIWEAASGHQLADLALGKKDVEHVTFSPDGQTLAVACKDKCVVILDVD